MEETNIKEKESMERKYIKEKIIESFEKLNNQL